MWPPRQAWRPKLPRTFHHLLLDVWWYLRTPHTIEVALAAPAAAAPFAGAATVLDVARSPTPPAANAAIKIDRICFLPHRMKIVIQMVPYIVCTAESFAATTFGAWQTDVSADMVNFTSQPPTEALVDRFSAAKRSVSGLIVALIVCDRPACLRMAGSSVASR